jgi:hypothetical protein
VALVNPEFVGPEYDRVGMWVKLGTMFGQATLAAVFSALGPGLLVQRLTICTAWLVCLGFAWLFNVWLFPQPDPVIILTASFGQWLLAQGLLWLIVWRRGTRIGFDGCRAVHSPAGLQFGIRQLLILTAMTAALLGTGRALAPTIQEALEGSSWREGPVFAFVVTTNIFLTLPLVLGALLPRNALVAVTVGLGFVALATWCEVSLLWLFIPGPVGIHSDVVVMFWLMNYLQAAWVLVPLSFLRLGGYRFASAKSTAVTAAVAQ